MSQFVSPQNISNFVIIVIFYSDLWLVISEVNYYASAQAQMMASNF